jgi:hypothetical protein
MREKGVRAGRGVDEVAIEERSLVGPEAGSLSG